MIARSRPRAAQAANYRPLIGAGLLMGAGLGGFLDGIVFHQLLQLHNMLSARLPPVSLEAAKINMLWDGLFHSFTWVMSVLALAMLWRVGERSEVPWSGRTYLGSLLCGWGLFNVLEGVIDHHLLGIHHVIERLGLSAADHAFVAVGAVLLVGGGLLVLSAMRGESRA
jgi:uncharacterized membrane protein